MNFIEFKGKIICVYEEDIAVYNALNTLLSNEEINERQFIYFLDKLFQDKPIFNEYAHHSHYNEYINSTKWEEKRKEIIDTYGGKCYICGTTDNLQGHHLNYESLGSENSDNVVCLCADCHKKIHELVDEVKGKAEDINTPKADAWLKYAIDEVHKQREELNKTESEIRSSYDKMRNTEVLSGGYVDEIAKLYVKKFGAKTIRGHLPKIGRVISETIQTFSHSKNFNGSAFITQAISKELRNRVFIHQ